VALYQNVPLYRAFFEPSAEIRASIDALVRTHRPRQRVVPKRVIDPACGVGLWLEHFRDRGATVAGVELDEAVAQSTARRLSDAVVTQGDMRAPPALVGGAFDVAINLDNSVGHLGDAQDLVAHLRAMHALMAPGGIYLVGVAVREAADTIDPSVIYERGPLSIDGGGYAALRSETHGLIDPDDTAGLRCERIRHYVLAHEIDGIAPLSIEQYDLLTFPHKLLHEALIGGGPWAILDCRDATDESLPRRRFAPGCGDVLLVLQPTQASTSTGGGGTAKLVRRKHDGVAHAARRQRGAR